MKTRNIILGMVAVAAAAVMTGCYEKFDTPPPGHQWTRAEIEAEGFEIISIGQLRQMFTDNVGDPASTTTYNKAYVVTGNYAVEGRVISNDAFGNFYRNIFIQDDGHGIEVKIGLGSMSLSYPVGSTMFVICKGLALGNYRKNLSLGLEDTSGSYATMYMDVQSLINRHVRRGERASSLQSRDTLVLNAANISSYLSTPVSNNVLKTELSGRLVRFEDAICTWGTFDNNNYPSFQNSTYDNIFFTEHFEAWEKYDSGETATPPADPRPANFYFTDRAPSWAFQEYRGPIRYYGNVRFTVGDCPIVVRTSGYSRFALDHVPQNNAVVDITGIVNLYTSSGGGFATNQMMLNNSTDVK